MDIIKEILSFINPWIQGEESEIDYISYLSLEGFELDIFQDNSGIYSILEQIKEIYNNLSKALDEENSNVDINALVSNFILILNSINNLSLDDGFEEDLQERGSIYFDELTYRYLFSRQKKILSWLIILKLIEFNITSNYSSYTKIHWMRLFPFILNPSLILTEGYGWKTSRFNYSEILSNLHRVLLDYGINSLWGKVNKKYSANFELNEVTQNQILQIPIFLSKKNDIYFSWGLSTMQLITQTNPDPSKIAVFLYGTGNLNKRIQIKEDLNIYFQTSADANSDYAIIITPEGIDLQQLSATSTSSPVRLSTLLSIEKSDAQEERMLLLGNRKGTRLEVGSVGFKIGAEVDISPNGASPDFQMVLPVSDGLFVIDTSKSDGFLKKILPKEGIRSDFNIAPAWSLSRGVHFEGSAGLDFQLPTHLELGPVEIQNLQVFIGVEDNGLIGKAGASIAAELGPLSLLIENVGLSTSAFIDEELNGNLGLFDIAFGFKPPNGIGLSIDASAVKGGGYLYIDSQQGLYYGAAALSIQEVVTVKAIGIINTKLPNGKEGYSFLIVISAEFTPLQIGMGFTINGVGGLVGIHRGINEQAINDGLRGGTLEQVLFPKAPVKNINGILASLNSYFPIAQEQFSFGLMFKLGWGVPVTLVDIQVGLVLKVPGPDLAILGLVRVLLPNKDKPILRLNVGFVGFYSHERKFMYFYASIFDSGILSISLEGDLLFYLDWGEQPLFVFSLGGFHPAYELPKLKTNIDTIKRIKLNLLAEDNPRLTLQLYMAVTSNTVQFGAALDFYVGAGPFNVVGWLYFDALFQFNPFYFIVELDAGLEVRAGDKPILGVAFSGSLEGPTPWRVKGKARFSILFFSFSVSIDTTFGEKRTTTLPPTNPLPELLAAIKHDRSWQVLPPARSSMLVTMRTIETTELVAHPNGTFILSQNKLPLNLDLDKYGNGEIADYKRFELQIEDFSITAPAKDYFAMEQFKNISQEEKLSRPSYELMQSGIKAEPDDKGVQVGNEAGVSLALCYEDVIIDAKVEPVVRQVNTEIPDELLNYARRQNALSKSAIGVQNFNRQFDHKIRQRYSFQSEQWAVADTASLVANSTAFSTFTEAKDSLDNSGTTQVVPDFELAETMP